MKKLIFLAASFFFIAAFLSCTKKDTEGISKVTYYPIFTYTGDDVYLIPTGQDFVDPGVTADANGVNVPVTTSVVGEFQKYTGTTIDKTLANRYVITYDAKNVDGFSNYAYRTVYTATTGDFVNSIEGAYAANVKRLPSQGSVSATADLDYIIIWKEGSTYHISDAIGGYYDLGRGYGNAYTASGFTFTADIAGGVGTPGPTVSVGTFGGAVPVTNIVIDAALKQITFTATWSQGYTFLVTLKQVQI